MIGCTPRYDMIKKKVMLLQISGIDTPPSTATRRSGRASYNTSIKVKIARKQRHG
jgi:hypothetical protein